MLNGVVSTVWQDGVLVFVLDVTQARQNDAQEYTFHFSQYNMRYKPLHCTAAAAVALWAMVNRLERACQDTVQGRTHTHTNTETK